MPSRAPCSLSPTRWLSQLAQLQQRADVVVIARSPYERIAKMTADRGWQGLNWLSAAHYRSRRRITASTVTAVKDPCAVSFVRQDGRVHHQWSSELLAVPRDGQPRHLDTLWPLWNLLGFTL